MTLEKKHLSKSYRFLITGIHCASCVTRIEKAVKALPQIEQANLNFADRSITIFADPSVSADTLKKTIENLGYGATLITDNMAETQIKQDIEQQHWQSLLRKTLVAAVIAVPFFILGMFDVFPSLETTTGFWVNLLLGLLTLGVLSYCGGHFFSGATKALAAHTANMDTLIALGTGMAWLYSMIAILFVNYLPDMARHVYFESAVVIIALVNFGALLELRARRHTSDAITRLMQLQPKTARVIRNQQELEIPIAMLMVDDLIRIRPGEQIPVDGTITEGAGTLDEAMLTGEPIPRHKTVNELVFAGTLNQNGSFIFKANHVGKETLLARIIQLVQEAQNSKPAVARLADRISAIFVPAVIVIAIITALIWFTVNIEPKAVYMLVTAVTVLVIACPCALGLAVPISVIIGIGKAAEFGVLIRHADALQQAGKLTTLVFDKTGTLTQGKPQVTGVYPATHSSEQYLLTQASSLELHSEHPFANAILQFAQQRGYVQLAVADFQMQAGQGISGTINNRKLVIGNAQFMQGHGISLMRWQDQANVLAQAAQTPIFVAEDQEILGIITIADPLKPDSQAAIARLEKLGFKIMMITGDHAIAAQAVASQLGIKQVMANILPQDKAEQIARLQASGEKVGMVGDGINDAPALALAEVGFAMGSGTDIAMETAGITLMRSSLHGVADAIEISRKTIHNIHQNLFGAFIYNVIGIPIAAGILFPFIHILLSPMLAGLAMALSSVTVVSNANRLRFFKPAKR